MKAYQFIRVLFGDPADPKSWVHHVRTQVQRVADKVDHWQHAVEPCTVYVFGRDNYNFVTERGFNAVLLDERPLVSPHRPNKNNVAWHHKPLAWKAAMQDYEHIVTLDWDVWINKPVDAEYIFRRLAEKAPLQACLYMYHRRMLKWRKDHQRKVPNAAFVYIGDREIAERIEHYYRFNEGWAEEHAMAWILDLPYGEQFCGIDTWLKLYEPFCCHMPKSLCISPESYGPAEDWIFTNN